MIRSWMRTRAENSSLVNNTTLAGQSRFIQDVMREEGCDMEQALRLCHGETDPVEYEITLGYKLADPIWAMGISLQVGKKARQRAAENFRAMLCPEEQVLFDQWIADGKLRRAVTTKLKEEKANGAKIDDSQLDLEEDD